MFAQWNVGVDNVDGDAHARTGVYDPWHLVGSSQHPSLRFGDCDADDDGLIAVCNLTPLNAVRWDLDGYGVSTEAGYAEAVPHAFKGMGCPDTGCASYELTDNLDFNPDGDGSFDADDEYWNNGAGRDPIGDSGYYDNSTKINTTFDGNGHVYGNSHV